MRSSEPERQSPPRARAIAQYGELFQGAVRDSRGRTRRCLVSLPCAALASTATFESAPPGATKGLTVVPAHKCKAARAAAITAARLGHDDLAGTLRIESTIPEGKGCSSSTADCVASVREIAAHLGATLHPEQLAHLVVCAERASGSIMFEEAVLFAHREGCVLDAYRKPLPPIAALGFDTEAGRTVDTLSFESAVYSPSRLHRLEELAATLRQAVLTQDARLVGAVATACAEINQEYLPKPCFHEIRAVASRTGALGIAVAHTGTVAAILLDARDPALPSSMAALEHALAALGASAFVRFHTGREDRDACCAPPPRASGTCLFTGPRFSHYRTA